MYPKWQLYDVWFLRYGAWQTEFFIILGYFLPFYPLKCPKNENFKKMKMTSGGVIILHKCTKNYDHKVYCSWDMVCDGCICYFSFWVIFCPFIPLTCPKNENFKKMKKRPEDIIILHKCTKSHDHMVYCSWDMACDRCNYFSFWVIFCPFTLLTAPQKKISKKWKKCLEISSFYVPKIMSRWCTVPEIRCTTDKRTDGQMEEVTHRGGQPT